MRLKRRRRLNNLIIILSVCAIIFGLILYALRQNISLFYTPSQLKTTRLPAQQLVRLGGVVQKNSIHRTTGLEIFFELTDNDTRIPVHYNGVLPDLFLEEKGAVVQGYWTGRLFEAQIVLAKHDENYKPPGVS